MQTIWKYPLQVAEAQTIAVPADSKVLHVALQADEPCLWMLVDPKKRKRKCEVLCFGTGHEVDAVADDYIGTVQTGPLVWHFFWGD